jgi:hypothetical protein
MAKLICGVNEITNESFNGKTIEEAMATAGPLLNIPADNLVILVNGDDAENYRYFLFMERNLYLSTQK